MKTALVIPALGIGDGLLMMIASHQLTKRGYRVTTVHHALPELSSWFPDHDIRPSSQIDSFDLIVAENDNSERIHALKREHRSRLSIFYPTYNPRKHGPLAPADRAFDPEVPMAENIAIAIASILGSSNISKENGISPYQGLEYRKNNRQILIHPTSRVPAKNWSKKGFITIARNLQKVGFLPLLCVSPQEREEWSEVEKEGLALAIPQNLPALAALIYESGYLLGNDSLAGHLASNLNIPVLIIANDRKRMQLWRPSWGPADLLFPPLWLPNFKFLRLKEEHWQPFVSHRKVLKAILNLHQKTNLPCASSHP